MDNESQPSEENAEVNLNQYIGRTLKVPQGTQRIEAIKPTDDPDKFVVTLSGSDEHGNEVYKGDTELTLEFIEMLYGSPE